MPRRARQLLDNQVYHVLNRANARMTIFRKKADYLLFESVLAETQRKIPVRLLAYCIMPDHWHLVLMPREATELSRFLSRLTIAHTQRWHVAHGTVGMGHVYHGRFRACPIQHGQHVAMVCRYVERNPVRAGKVKKAGDWPWSSLYRRLNASKKTFQAALRPDVLLGRWPVKQPSPWRSYVNKVEPRDVLEELRTCVHRGRPFGTPTWQKRTAARLGLENTFRGPGRPPKPVKTHKTTPTPRTARNKRA